MREWWRQFVAMPDADRARILARISAVALVALLYALGGVSLYLRRRYLRPAVGDPAGESPMSELVTNGAAATTLPAAEPTLYPTMTPSSTATGTAAAGSGTSTAPASTAKLTASAVTSSATEPAVSALAQTATSPTPTEPARYPRPPPTRRGR